MDRIKNKNFLLSLLFTIIVGLFFVFTGKISFLTFIAFVILINGVMYLIK